MTPVLGYIDAGSTSFIFQAAVGAVFAGSFFVKSWLRKLRGRGDE